MERRDTIAIKIKIKIAQVKLGNKRRSRDGEHESTTPGVIRGYPLHAGRHDANRPKKAKEQENRGSESERQHGASSPMILSVISKRYRTLRKGIKTQIGTAGQKKKKEKNKRSGPGRRTWMII